MRWPGRFTRFRSREFGYDTWPKDAYKYAGGANTWGEISVDAKRGIAYFPTGSPTYDYYGADRIGANLFANCLLALPWAWTGSRRSREAPTPAYRAARSAWGWSTGLLFATAKDGKVRAYSADDGKILWTGELPHGTEGLPAMYEANGRQYLVVCATTGLTWGPRSREGGGWTQGDIESGGKKGAYVVFALDREASRPGAGRP